MEDFIAQGYTKENLVDLFTNGTAISGDITNLIRLYDAGTEIEQYAGADSDQPARQSEANSGADENGVVETETKMVRVYIHTIFFIFTKSFNFVS